MSRNLNGQQFTQLPMFMSARELYGTHSIEVQQTPESRFGGARRSMPEMWSVKRRENKRSGLDKDVAAQGVQQPVELTSGRDVIGNVIYNGHHRIEAAHRADPDMLVPVEHLDLDKRGF
jgi:hypothetical protein